MNVAALQNNAAENVSIDRLAGDSALTPQQKVAEVSRQFEALLLRQVLQETQKTVIQSSYADDSTSAGIYHDMVINQLADSISKSGTLGLSQTLEQQLGRQVPQASAAGPGLPAGSKPTSPPGKQAVRPTLLTTPAGRALTRRQFKPGGPSALQKHLSLNQSFPTHARKAGLIPALPGH